MDNNKIYNVIIIGSGPAGYTASIYCARALLQPLIIMGDIYGGQLMTTTEIENFPGYKSISGRRLMQTLHEQTEDLGTTFELTNVTKIIKKSPFELQTENGKIFKTLSIILATGATAMWLNAKNEYPLRSNGISTCATCDGAFFKNEDLVVVGGGDSAMEEAIFLTRFAKKVIIIHRREEFRASKIMVDRAKKNEKIFWETSCQIKEWILDENKSICGANVYDTKNNSDRKIQCTGAFIAIGHKPNTEFLKDIIELDDEGYIKTFENTMTNVDGIFACGDVVDKKYRQAITASGQGCMSAMDCEKWLVEQK